MLQELPPQIQHLHNLPTVAIPVQTPELEAFQNLRMEWSNFLRAISGPFTPAALLKENPAVEKAKIYNPAPLTDVQQCQQRLKFVLDGNPALHNYLQELAKTGTVGAIPFGAGYGEVDENYSKFKLSDVGRGLEWAVGVRTRPALSYAVVQPGNDGTATVLLQNATIDSLGYSREKAAEVSFKTYAIIQLDAAGHIQSSSVDARGLALVRSQLQPIASIITLVRNQRARVLQDPFELLTFRDPYEPNVQALRDDPALAHLEEVFKRLAPNGPETIEQQAMRAERAAIISRNLYFSGLRLSSDGITIEDSRLSQLRAEYAAIPLWHDRDVYVLACNQLAADIYGDQFPELSRLPGFMNGLGGPYIFAVHSMQQHLLQQAGKLEFMRAEDSKCVELASKFSSLLPQCRAEDGEYDFSFQTPELCALLHIPPGTAITTDVQQFQVCLDGQEKKEDWLSLQVYDQNRSPVAHLALKVGAGSVCEEVKVLELSDVLVHDLSANRRLLDIIRHTKPGEHGTTFVVDAHGNPDSLWVAFDRRHRIEHDQYIHVKELADAFIERFQRFGIPGERSKYDILVLHSCDSLNFVENFKAEIRARLGHDIPLIVVDASEYGQYSYMNPDKPLGSLFWNLLANPAAHVGKPGFQGVIRLGDIMDALGKGQDDVPTTNSAIEQESNLGIFVPDTMELKPGETSKEQGQSRPIGYQISGVPSSTYLDALYG